jgi:hypothetical protein
VFDSRAAFDLSRPPAPGTASASFGAGRDLDDPALAAAVSPSARGGATRVGSSESLVVASLPALKVIG